jgi:two-component system CheB/CheR fusion protein
MENIVTPKIPEIDSQSNGWNSSAERKDFLTVGIGASAGGIKPLKEFFAALPDHSGMAFVVILHLSPEHESQLPAVLQPSTRMPVIQVKETVKVEPNHVYVIPPSKHLAMVDGEIRLIEPNTSRGKRVPVDLFFRTLAEAHGKNCVCIILSGTGADGAIGLK